MASAAKPVLSPSPLDLLLLGNTEESFYLIVKIPAACSPQTSTMLMNLAATRGTPYRKVVTFAWKRPAESEGVASWPRSSAHDGRIRSSCSSPGYAGGTRFGHKVLDLETNFLQ